MCVCLSESYFPSTSRDSYFSNDTKLTMLLFACCWYQAGSVDVLHCYYAHGEDNVNFQRRCYWMLDP